MQPINLNLPTVQLDTRGSRILDTLQNLQQVGLFKAVVVKQSGSQVLLDTAFGKLTGKAPEQLKAGDEILARLTALKPQPTLKIEQHIARMISLGNSSLKNLVQNNPASLLSAKVVSQDNQHTFLKIKNELIPINRQAGLQNGETVLLKESAKNQLQLIRVQPQLVLKAALSSLIPRSLSLQQGQRYDLSSLQTIARELTTSNREALIDRANIKQLTLIQQGRLSLDKHANTPDQQRIDQQNLGSANRHSGGIKAMLLNLANPLLDIQNIRPQSLQQVLTYLAFIKTNMPDNSNNLGQQLQHLLAALKQSPEGFRHVMREVFPQPASTQANTQQAENSFNSLSNTLRLELLQQTEQTLNHLLTQQTTTKLQLEQQQPLNLFLNIPLQLEQENRKLALSIRQNKKNQYEATESSWEIELSFEFGLLGMITTRILLQGQKISANFWTQQTHTKMLIDTHMDQFKKQLTRAGFELGLFDCFKGTAPQPVQRNQFNTDNLLDLEA